MVHLLETKVSVDYLLRLKDLDTPIAGPLEIAWRVLRVEADADGFLETVSMMLDGAPVLLKKKNGRRGAKEGSRMDGGRAERS